MDDPHRQSKSESKKRLKKAIIVLSILLVVLIGLSAFMFVKYKREANNNPVARQKQLTSQLGELIVMPPEEPVISTVLDSSKLTNKTLAGKARNGDQLFIFPKSKRLVLYRPANDKVVDILNIQN